MNGNDLAEAILLWILGIIIGVDPVGWLLYELVVHLTLGWN